MAYSTSDIRNLLVGGHAGCGKTTLTEALLKTAGVIGTIGSIEEKNTVSDHAEEEHEHGHSLFTSIVHADYKDKHINLIDTPGFPDFFGQTVCAMPAVETAAVVIDAATGIEPITRRLMHRAAERKLCRMIMINKIDSENVDLPTLVEQIRESFGKECLPVNLPTDGGKNVTDCFFTADGDSDFGSVAEAHTAIVEQVVEVDEELAMAYLEGKDVEPKQLHNVFEQALRSGHLVPICFTAARPHHSPDTSVGIEALLDVLVNLAPNPMEGNPRPFVQGEGENEHEFHAEPDENMHLLAHVFQVRIDPFVGKLCAFRVHQGCVTKDSQVFIGDPQHGESKRPFKVGHLFKLQGKEHVEIDKAVPGDIAAVAKIEELHFDCVLHDSHDEDKIHLRQLDFPEPMQGLAVETDKRGDEQKLADALGKFQEEDPTFKVTRDPTTKQTVLYGLGDLHLRVMLEKLKHRYGVEVQTAPPKIAYRETITGNAEGHHRHKKQTGGAGQFGEVYLRLEALERGTGFEFADDTFGGSIPQQFIPAIEKGVRQAMENGVLAGYPVQDVKVSVYDGKHHPVDSKEVAFITAGKKAFIDAFHKAHPVVLEPIALLEVTVPSQYMGDINSDLSGKRGRIQGTDMLPGDQVLIKAQVPLAEVTTYQSQLKSVTAGQGSFHMELSHYDPVPGNVQQQIMAQYQPHEEEE